MEGIKISVEKYLEFQKLSYAWNKKKQLDKSDLNGVSQFSYQFKFPPIQNPANADSH